MRQGSLFENADSHAGVQPGSQGLASVPDPVAEGGSSQSVKPASGEADDLATVRAGWPEEADEGCVRLDPAAVLGATSRSFALRVRGESMGGAGIHDGDVVVGEFVSEANSGAIVVALIDGESTLKRLVTNQGKPYLTSERVCEKPGDRPHSAGTKAGLGHAIAPIRPKPAARWGLPPSPRASHAPSGNASCPDLVPLSELVIQGVVRCVVRKVK